MKNTFQLLNFDVKITISWGSIAVISTYFVKCYKHFIAHNSMQLYKKRSIDCLPVLSLAWSFAIGWRRRWLSISSLFDDFIASHSSQLLVCWTAIAIYSVNNIRVSNPIFIQTWEAPFEKRHKYDQTIILIIINLITCQIRFATNPDKMIY